MLEPTSNVKIKLFVSTYIILVKARIIFFKVNNYMKSNIILKNFY